MKSDVKSIVTLFAGISLCGFTGYFLYLLFKKDKDFNDYSDTANINGVQQKLEVRIPAECVRAVIGRNGSNIKEIERKNQVRIKFDELRNDTKYRVCVIRGSRINCMQAESMLFQFISNQPVIDSREHWIPNVSIGKIIGRGGDRINYITQLTGTKIRISEFPDRDRRRVTLKGTKEQIDLALSYIEEIVREDVDTREKLEHKLAQRQPRGKSKNGQSKPLKVTKQSAEKLCSNIAGGDGQMEVYVSAVVDPSQFWLQIVGPKANELDQLVEEMTDYYSKPENQEFHVLSEPGVGEIVAAVFRYDSKWYRAEITDIATINDRLAARLYFLDYGDTDDVPVEEIFELRTDFLRLRFQAIECYLARVKPVHDNWSVEAIDRFDEWTQTAQWKKLRARVSGYKERDASRKCCRAKREGSPIPGVDLYDISNQEDVDIALELVKNGYAVFEEGNGASSSPRRNGASPSPKSSVGDEREHLVNGHSDLSSLNDGPENAQNKTTELADALP